MTKIYRKVKKKKQNGKISRIGSKESEFSEKLELIRKFYA